MLRPRTVLEGCWSGRKKGPNFDTAVHAHKRPRLFLAQTSLAVKKTTRTSGGDLISLTMALPKAPISLAWRLVGDLLATRVSVGRGDVAATFPGGFAGREGVAVKSNMFDFFCDSLETFSSLQLVSETSRRLNMFSRRKTSPRPARDQMIEKKLRRRLRDVSATSRRRLRDSEATSPRRRLTYFYRPRKEIITKAKTCIYL